MVKLQCTVSYLERARCKLAVVNQVQQILGNLLLAQLVWRGVEIVRQLSHFSQVTVLGLLGSTEKLQVTAQLMTKG